MTYQEWVAMTEDQMANTAPVDILDLLLDLPFGMIEPDPEKQAKLNNVLMIACTGGVLVHDYDHHQLISSIGNAIVKLMPDDTHSQSFALGMMAVFVTFANTVNELKKQGKV